ncbi:MAG: FtsX-like permease family protein [Oligoflexia bacterium]|nr:FtsX-like permease family protein [Oligoflexia bacterium]
MNSISQIFLKFAYLFTTIVIITSIILSILSLLHRLNRKTHEFGILKAIGWTPSEIKKHILKETLVISLIGGIVGIILAFVINYLLTFISIQIIIPWEMGSSIPHFLMSNPEAPNIVNVPLLFIKPFTLSLIIILLLLVIAGIIGLWMAQKANNIKPVEALKHE